MTAHPIVVFTDGAAKRNPGPGGWGVVIVTPDGHVTELGGGAPLTTNNKMELSGAIAALTHLERTERPFGRLHRLHLRHPGRHAVGAQLAAPRLEDGRRRRGAEPRAVGRAVGPDGGAAAAFDRLALRARALGHPRQRARRCNRRRLCRARPRAALRRARSSATTSRFSTSPTTPACPSAAPRRRLAAADRQRVQRSRT